MEPEQPVEQSVVPPEPTGEGQHISFQPPAVQTKKPGHVWRWISLAAIVLLVIALGLLIAKTVHKSKAAQKSTTSQSPSSQAAKTATDNVATKSFQSTTFNLSFDYPESWKVNDSGTPPLTVVSPVMTLTDATGKKLSGEVVMTILPQGQVPAQFGNANAIAVRESEKITYKKPTPSQRAQTYLSFVQYAATTTHGALDGIYITGNVGYTKGQPVPKADVAARDPDVNVTFIKCANTACNGTSGPVSIQAGMWDDQSFQAPIKTMLTSLAFE